ncbi:Transcriptional regulator, xre family [Apilactobacillus kunkeei]|uniref:helix-turn-helix domain-containing protein n=1 Tax=Apilactobacillus kunkeei TaxID=148814 RepID=UPI0006C17046|nr:helix-turn-helix transcriptional regulator [Apilactobacillus kunkeei]KOY76082.1 Transcriptional regulator, xre family [Apilactobacillus kunkeei]
MKFGDRLKQQRKIKNLTQDDVAAKLNVSRQTISSWENEKSYPDIKSLTALSDMYDISLDTMLKEDSGMKEFIEKNDLRKKLYGLTYFTYALYGLVVTMLIYIISNIENLNLNFQLLGGAIFILSLALMISISKTLKELNFLNQWNPINQTHNKTFSFFAVVIVSSFTSGLFISRHIYIPFIIFIVIYEAMILIYYLRNR